MHLKGEDWRRFWGKKAAQKVPEWPSYGNFCKVTQNPHFLKKYKRGTKRNLSKIAQKVALAWKAAKNSGANGILLYLVCTSSAKTGDNFGRENGSKSPRMAQLWQFKQGHPNPAFSEKVQRGDQEKFLKNRPKSSLRLKGPKAPWRKWHYPRTSMHLKCKDWRRFSRKTAPKVPEWPGYGKLCKVTQNPHFQKKWKGDTKRRFSKIAQKVAFASMGQKHSGASVNIL